jgi:hypothetical protein
MKKNTLLNKVSIKAYHQSYLTLTLRMKHRVFFYHVWIFEGICLQDAYSHSNENGQGNF